MDLVAVAPPAWHRLTADERARSAYHGDELVRRATWEGASGVELTDHMIATVAANAAVLAAGFDERSDPFRNVAAIVIHVGTIVDDRARVGPTPGLVTTGRRWLAGHAGSGTGPVVLDWRTVEREVGRPQGGTNVVYHEFAHKLDFLDGDADGMPPLPDDEARAAWRQTLGTNFRRLRRHGSDGLVRAYGATNEAEYFAVTTELFFTRPAELADRHPRVYERLSEFYRQDPAARA